MNRATRSAGLQRGMLSARRSGLLWRAPLAWALLTSAVATAEDLWDVYSLALENEPQFAEAAAARRATQERLPEARAALLPQINAVASREEESEQGERVGLVGEGIGLANTDTEATSTSYGVEVRQPLLRWDRWIRLRQAGTESERADLDYRVRVDALVLRAVDRYFGVLSAEDALAAARAGREAAQEQLQQARDRMEVGLAAVTDLQEARAAHDQARAEEIEAEHAVRIARDALRTVTGRRIDRLARPTRDVALPDLEPLDEQGWLQRVLEANPEIGSARLSADIAQREVQRQQSARLPTVDIVAGRTEVDRESGNLFDTFDLEGDSVRLEVAVPIFAGGAITARTRQARFQSRAASKRLESVRLDIEERTRAAFLNIQASTARVQAFRQAVVSAEAALEATQAGYEAGTRTVSEVLQSQRNLLDAQTSLSRAIYDHLSSRLRLAVLAGSLDEQQVRDINALLTVK